MSHDYYHASGKKYWYMTYVEYCPVCGKEDTWRERRYTPRPEKWEDRHDFKEVYDWCNG